MTVTRRWLTRVNVNIGNEQWRETLFSLCHACSFELTRKNNLHIIVIIGAILTHSCFGASVHAEAATDSRHDAEVPELIAEAEAQLQPKYTIEIIPPVDGQSLGVIIYRPANGEETGPPLGFGGPR